VARQVAAPQRDRGIDQAHTVDGDVARDWVKESEVDAVRSRVTSNSERLYLKHVSVALRSRGRTFVLS
jgi:hypothetical protein